MLISTIHGVGVQRFSQTIQRHHSLFALAVFILLSTFYTWPLLTHFTTHVIGPFKTDNFEILWKMWWVPHALFERGISPFFVPDLYYPFGYPLAYGEVTPLLTFFMMPVTLLFGEIVSYNIAAFLSAVLSGWLMYLFARRQLIGITTSANLMLIGGFFAGIAFAFCAYRVQRIGGHLNLAGTQWLVLAFYGLDRWLETRRLRDAALTALGISLSALGTWYYGFLLVLTMPVYAVFALENWRAVLANRRTWAGVVLIAVITALLCVPFLIPYLQVAAEGQATIPVDNATFWAASPDAYLYPNPHHWLWGEAVQAVVWPFPGVGMPHEFMLSIGWLTIFFGVIGWRLREPHRRWRRFKAVIVVAFVLSLGPYLKLGPIPLGVPLPALLLRELFSFAESIRSWGRFAVLVMLGMSLLASAGVVHWLAARRHRTALATVIFALLIFVTWNGPAALVKVEGRPVDAWLAQQSDRDPVIQYPLQVALTGSGLFYTRYHQHPAAYSTGTFFQFLFEERHPDLYTFPQDAALDQLEAWGVRYILVETDELGATEFTLADVEAQPRLRHIITLDDQAVYELIR